MSHLQSTFTNFVQSWIQVYFPTLHTRIRQLRNKNTLHPTTCLQEHKTIQFPGFADGHESNHQYLQSRWAAHTGHTCTCWHHPTVQYLWIGQEHPQSTHVLVGTIQQFSICELGKNILKGLKIALDIHKKIHHGFIWIRFMQALYTLHLTAEHQNSTHINPLPPLHLQGLNRIN